MLKAHMINKFGEDSIYYKDNKDRTIALENCLQKVITNQGFAIKIEHLHFITKDRNQETSFVHVDKNAEAGVKIIKELKDPNYTHKYTMKTALKEINRRLQSEGIELEVNQYIFGLFTKVYGIKENEKFCYVHRQYAQPSYTYSMQAIELIVNEILKDPENIVENLKKATK